MEHLRKYIGIYLLAMLGFLIYASEPTDDMPVWVFYLMIPVVLWKTPPFNIGDWFWGKVSSFWMWVLGPFLRWQETWPSWVKFVFGIIVIILFEEYILNPMEYTMYPWRMDFGG